jgi:hypothetical protein
LYKVNNALIEKVTGGHFSTNHIQEEIDEGVFNFSLPLHQISRLAKPLDSTW